MMWYNVLSSSLPLYYLLVERLIHAVSNTSFCFYSAHNHQIFMYTHLFLSVNALQLVERVVVLLGCWDRWSLFPASYLAGLEAFFFLTEADYLEIKEQERSLSEAGGKEDFESVRRRAKLAGVAVSEESSAAEVGAKMMYVEKYTKAKSQQGREEEEFSITVSAGARERGQGQGQGQDSVPQRPPGMSTAMRWASIGRGQERGGIAESDDRDDVDGVPMGAGIGTGRGAGRLNSADSDIDGEEYDGLDGVPLGVYGIRAGAGVSAVDSARQSSSGERGSAYDDYDDDVDGVPLDAPVVSNPRNTNSSTSVSMNAAHVPGKRRRNSEDDSRVKTKSNRKEKDRSKSEKYASDSSDSDGDKGPGRIDFL